MGLPASGKTYFSQKIAAEQDVFFLNVDNLRLAMVEKPAFDAAEHHLVYSTVDFIAEQHLAQGKSIICNGNYHIRKRRESMEKMTQRYQANCQIIWVKTPYEIVRERILKRDHEIPVEKMVHPPLELLERMNKASESPTSEESTIVIDGTLEFSEQHASFLRQLDKVV